jgi:hypothetical protein
MCVDGVCNINIVFFCMGKKSFVRVSVAAEEFRLRRDDIRRTHFIRRRTLPPLPSYPHRTPIEVVETVWKGLRGGPADYT